MTYVELRFQRKKKKVQRKGGKYPERDRGYVLSIFLPSSFPLPPVS